MTIEQRSEDPIRERQEQAARDLERDGQLVCVCGQLFLYVETYLEHHSTCRYAMRSSRG